MCIKCGAEMPAGSTMMLFMLGSLAQRRCTDCELTVVRNDARYRELRDAELSKQLAVELDALKDVNTRDMRPLKDIRLASIQRETLDARRG